MSNGEPSLEQKVAYLGAACALPGGKSAVRRLETHMSWVFLTDDRVYKLKKPVRFAYLDFSTIEAREAMCRAEAYLNRRLARDVYLGVMPLLLSPQGLSLDKPGRIVDWLVVMRRLGDDGLLDHLISERRAMSSHFDAVARTLARFYKHAQRQSVSPAQCLARWRRNIAANRDVLFSPRFALPVHTLRRVDLVQRLYLSERGNDIMRRALDGRIVEGHGDLRPEHIWIGHEVKIIDCLEFNADLRHVDPLEELAYLHVECRRLGAAWGGERVRRAVCAALRDPAPEELYVFYRCYHATLRARLAIAHLLEPDMRLPEKWPKLARVYLQFAAEDARRLAALISGPRGSRDHVPRAFRGSPPQAKARRAVLRLCDARRRQGGARRSP